MIEFFFKYDAERGRWLPNLLIEGVFILVRICFWAALLGLAIGFLMGVCRTSNVLFFRLLARGYVEFVRNMPPIPFLFIMFFFVGNQILKPLELTAAAQEAPPLVQGAIFVLFGEFEVLRNFAAAAIALALYEGAYITEIVRAGIQSLERGQWEAGQSPRPDPLPAAPPHHPAAGGCSASPRRSPTSRSSSSRIRPWCRCCRSRS